MNITQTVLSGHRKIIVPQGILDPNKTHIIHIPKELANTQAPLVVTLTRKGLIARLLPDFKDELSKGAESERQRLTAAPPLCPVEGRSKEKSKRAANVTYNRTFDIDAPQTDAPADQTRNIPSRKPAPGYGYSSGDAAGPYPKVFHVSSKATRRVQHLPQEGHSIAIDAPEGIDIRSLQKISSHSRPGGQPRDANITTTRSAAPAFDKTFDMFRDGPCSAPKTLLDRTRTVMQPEQTPVRPIPRDRTQNIQGARLPDQYDLSGACGINQCRAPCGLENTFNIDLCAEHYCPAPCGPQNTFDIDLCNVSGCPAPCSPIPTSGANQTFAKHGPAPAQNATFTSQGPGNRTFSNPPAASTPYPANPQAASTPYPFSADLSSVAPIASSSVTGDRPCNTCNENQSVLSSFNSFNYTYKEQTQDPDAYRYAQHNVLKRFEASPPPAFGRVERNWQEAMGGFQPQYISTPNEDHGGYDISAAAAATGYYESLYAPSEVDQHVWESPPNLGLPKASWYTEKTEYVDYFDEERNRIRREEEEEERRRQQGDGQCPCTPPNPPRN